MQRSATPSGKRKELMRGFEPWLCPHLGPLPCDFLLAGEVFSPVKWNVRIWSPSSLPQ